MFADLCRAVCCPGGRKGKCPTPEFCDARLSAPTVHAILRLLRNLPPEYAEVAGFYSSTWHAVFDRLIAEEKRCGDK